MFAAGTLAVIFAAALIWVLINPPRSPFEHAGKYTEETSDEKQLSPQHVPVRVNPAPAPISSLTPKQTKKSEHEGVTTDLLVSEICPKYSACRDNDAAKKIAKKRPIVHLVGKVISSDKAIFSDSYHVILEGRKDQNVSLDFEEGSGETNKIKVGDNISARCKYNDVRHSVYSKEVVLLKDCKLVAPPKAFETKKVSWPDYKIPVPEKLKSLSESQITEIDRALDVRYFLTGNANITADLAEETGIHVDILGGARKFIGAQMVSLSEGLRDILDADLEIRANYYAPMISTLFGGNYVADLELTIDGCLTDGKTDLLEEKGLQVLKRARSLMPPKTTAIRVTRIEYNCAKLGIKKDLDMGYYWRLDEKEPRLMRPQCSGTYGFLSFRPGLRWCQSAWSDEETVEMLPFPKVGE